MKAKTIHAAVAAALTIAASAVLPSFANDVPATAVWTGAASNNNFADPGNWSCLNAQGEAVSSPCAPNEQTVKYILGADADWTSTNLTLAAGVTLDLAGHKLKVNGSFSVAASTLSGNNIVSNPSFENGFSTGSYTYWSATSHATDWIWNSSGAGVGSSRNGQPWIGVGVPDGTYVCFLQSNTSKGASITQSLTIDEAGYYEVSLAYAARRDSGYSGGIVSLSIADTVCLSEAITRSDTAVRRGRSIVWLDAGNPTLEISVVRNPVEANSAQDAWVDMISVKKVAGSGNAGIVDTSSGLPGELRIEMASGDAMNQPVTFNGNMTASYVLTGDADWTAAGTINLAAGVLLDLNGHTLKVANVTGPGVVIDNANAYYSLHQASDGAFYVEADYLQANVTGDKYNHASEWINTRYVHNANTVVDMKVQITESTTDWYCYYGARNGTATALGGWIHRAYHYKGVTADADSSAPYPSTPYDVHMEFGGTCTFGDFSYTSGAGGSCSRYDYLFAMNNNGSPGFIAKARVFYCLVREKNAEAQDGYDVMRDFVPVKRLSDNVCGMFDRQNKKFYANNGGGAFTIGSYATAEVHDEFGSSGVLQIAVPANTTLSLDDMAKIVGDVKVVKEGAGVLVYVEGTSVQTYFHGGYEDHSAPVTAVWTGAANNNDFNDPGNWSCTNDLGSALAGMAPDATTLKYILGANADWTAEGAFTFATGVTLDLAGYNLTVENITGGGMVVDMSDNTANQNVFTASDGIIYQKTLYTQATQEGASNKSTDALNKIQYVDTGYNHTGTTKVDIRVEFQDVSYGDNYGYAVFYGCRELITGTACQLGGWIHGSKFYYYDTAEHDGSAAKVNTIYDVHLDKGGASYANYADGTRAANLGTGNGQGPNTWGTDYIFANNQVSNGGKYWPCRCKVYSCKVYEGDEPKRDFIPVVCLSGENAGKAGFWCTVTERFYGNSGYGVLTAGPVKKSATTATGSVTITVDENDTLPLASISPIHGNVKVVKMGAGTLAVPTTGVYFTGGIDVQAGALSFAGPVTSVEGLNLGNVTVASGAKATLPATDGAKYGEAFTLNGGTLELVCSGTAEPVTTYITNSVALNAGAKIRFDTSSLQSTQFLLSTDGFTLGTGVESAVSCAELSDSANTIAEANGANEILVTVVTAPVTAVWTGAANNNDFNDPGNWSCTNVVGGALVDTIPDSHTVNYVLAVDADWSAATVTIPEGATLNMNGHRLKVAGLAGTGTITDAASGYLALEYLEGTGTQYIKTGYTMNSGTADFKAQFTATPTDNHWHGVFGMRSGGNEKAALCVFVSDNNSKGTAYFWKTMSGQDVKVTDLGVVALNTDYTFHLDKSGHGPCTITGGSLTNATLGTATAGTSTAGPAYIFNLKQGGGVWDGNRSAHMRLYYLTFSENGTPVHDFVPARRLPDGVLGLYDKNNGAFLVNSGSGSFTGGNVKSELALDPVAGGELEVCVPEGQTVTISTVNIAGSVKLVKTGLGTLVMSKAQAYLNGTEVEAGTIKPGTASLATPYGAVGSKISATASGTVDFNGNANMNKYVYEFADGAKALNGGAAISSGAFTFTSFYTPVSTGAFTASLADGATLNLTEWNGAWPIANVTAPAGATVTVKVNLDDEKFRTLALSKDAETGKYNGKLLSFGGVRPANTAFVPDAVSANRCKFIEDENGDIILEFLKGFTLYFR